MKKILIIYMLVTALQIISCAGKGIPNNCRQLIVTVAPDWNSKNAELMLFQRNGKNNYWQRLRQNGIPVLLGKNGMAWGIGVTGQDEPGLHKKEGDGRTPAGIFKIGKIYGNPAKPPKSATDGYMPYVQVTKWHAWVDDPRNPYYNRHLVFKPNQTPPWFQSQRMKPEDPTYYYLIEIRHNSDPPISGRGSAIFFHTRRSPWKPTAGCTAMKRNDLVSIIKWLSQNQDPHYVALPHQVYLQKMQTWKLPKIK